MKKLGFRTGLEPEVCVVIDSAIGRANRPMANQANNWINGEHLSSIMTAVDVNARVLIASSYFVKLLLELKPPNETHFSE